MILLSCTDKLKGLPRLALVLFSAMLLLLLPACVEEQTTPPDNEKTISFSLNVPQNFTPQTYAIPDGVDANNKYGDAKIGSVDVLLFDKSGNFFSGPHYGAIGTTTGTDNSIDVTIRISEDTENDFVMGVFANSRSFFNSVTFNTADNKATTLNKITVEKNKWDADASDGNAGYIHIPMYGEGTLSSYTGGEKVKLHRMLARINVTNTYEGFPTFNFKNVYLANYNTVGQVAYTSLTTGDNPIPALNVASDPKRGTTAITYPVTSNTCNNEIFTFEAAAGTPATFGTNPCIIIGGEYDGVGKYYYYRVDFADANGDYIPIFRNHSYNVLISKIDGPGYSDIEDAIKSKPINIKYDVEEWNDTNIVDAAYNGQYVIGVSAAKFNFDSAARDENSGDNILYIQTNHPDGWSATIEGENSTWLSLINLDGSAITGPVAEASSKVKLKLALNGGTVPRTATIKLTAGNVVYSVSVTQSHEANSNTVFPSEAADYIIPIGDKIFIPVSRANAGATINLGSNDVFTAELVTSDDPNVIRKVEPFGVGSGGHVYVEAGSVAGKAEVGIRYGADNGYTCTWNVEVVEHIGVSGLADSYVLNGDTYSFTLYTDETFSITPTSSDYIASFAVDGVPGTTGAAGFKVISFTTNPVTTGDRRNITFTITLDGGVTKDVTFVGVPSIIASGLADSYVLNGSTYTFELETAAAFTIENLSTTDIASITSSGNAGVNTISFTTNEVYSLLGNRSVTFRVTTSSGNKDITIVGIPLTFTPAPMSNSYIVNPAPSTTIFIPVSQLYRAMAGYSEYGSAPTSAALPSNWANADDSFVSELVWKDNNSITFNSAVIGSGSAAYIRLEITSSDQKGNAVVGIRRVNPSTGLVEGGFLWSWHIWVTGYTPTKGTAGKTLMDRNLGALNNGFLNNEVNASSNDYISNNIQTLGLLYQWGRKDPFPGTSTLASTDGGEPILYSDNAYLHLTDNNLKKVSVSNIASSIGTAGNYTTYSPPASDAPQNLGYAVSNPHIFYYQGSSNDWYTSSSTHNNNLWGNSKTVYDPCPPGWKVPIQGGYSNGVTSNNPAGWNWLSSGDNKGRRVVSGTGSFSDAWFPAAGLRWGDSDAGILDRVGTHGYCWSASPVSGNPSSYCLYFTSTSASPSNSSTRALGYSVRCTQE